MWFKVDDRLADHRKARKAGTCAMGLWVLAGSWAAAHLTDGWVPRDVALRYGTQRQAERLVAAGLWEPGEVDGEPGWFFHAWSEYQPTRKEVEQKRLRAAERQAKWRAKNGENAGQDGESRRYEGVSNGVSNAAPDPTRPDPTIKEHHVGDESPPRDDIERICNHLADRIEANGSKRPTITKRWRDAARLMLDKDGRTEEQIHRAIDWCQDDEFWRANILSLPKLRDKFDQLRLQATRDRSRGEARAVGWQALKNPPEFAARAVGAQLRVLPPGGEWE